MLSATEPENTAEALQQVGIAIQKGASYATLIQDPDLAPLRMQTEQWNALIKKYFPEIQKD
ncbi:MAG: hypothetical protein IPK76_02925 [Lewinellaceae bacterium]|nr:hypothetical protein [Lewinellaceae bacterium]